MDEDTLLIDKTVKKVEFLCRCTGINVKSCQKTQKDTIKSRITYIFNFIWLNTDLTGEVAWFFNGIMKSKSFTELTYVAPCITLSILANMKSLNVILREDKVDELIQVLRNLEINERGRPKHPEKDAIMKHEHNFVTRVISIFNVFYCVLTVCFAFSSLTLVALKYYTTNELELLLPLYIFYPFDSYDIRYWPWVYLHQSWSITIVIIDICTADYLFYTFCTYIRMQFRLLKHDIERLIPDDLIDGRLQNIKEIRTELVVLVKWHQDLISYEKICIRKRKIWVLCLYIQFTTNTMDYDQFGISSANILEPVYTRSTLLNFVTSSVLICLTGFNVMVNSDIVIVITFLMFLFTFLLQILLLCFFGDLLMTSSMEVSDAVYNCRWYLADTRLGKDLLLMQTRAQTPCKLTACNFAEVNLKAFMKILSTAWSYFALLQTLYGSPT